MAEKVIMPKAGMAMETGVIISWLKEVGDPVSVGEPLLEIETDKTSMQVESMSEGYLLCKLYGAGDQVPVVTTIGYIGQQGETPPAQADQADQMDQAADQRTAPVPKAAQAPPSQSFTPAPKGTGDKTIPATPLARAKARRRGIPLGDIPAGGVIRARDVDSYRGGPAVKATPLASRVAALEGIDLAGVRGSGHGGKIHSADLPRAAAETSAVEPPAAGGGTIPLNAMRRTIARRMLQSHQEVPPVTLHAEADVTRLWSVRRELGACEGVKISFNDLVVKACAAALSEFPAVNSSFTEEGTQRHSGIHIGIAVALDDGLIVPVLRDAGSYSMRKLSEKARDLAARARTGKLTAEECSGATFTVSNLGMFGVTAFTPIINQPESCILGVCSIRDRVVPDGEGGFSARKFMGLSLTFDHRCLDGAGGAKFLQRVTALLENPMELLL